MFRGENGAEVECVSRRATEDIAAVFEKDAGAQAGAHSAAGEAQAAQALGRFEGEPEAQERSETEGEKMRSPGRIPAACSTNTQSSIRADHDSGVSSHRSGAPVVPLVW